MKHSSDFLRKSIRSLVGAICRQYNIPGRSLKLQLQGLHEEGYISTNDVSTLDSFWEAGKTKNKQMLSDEQVNVGLEILNHMWRMMIYRRGPLK